LLCTANERSLEFPLALAILAAGTGRVKASLFTVAVGS
jgi:hypothetical protein